MIAWKIGGDQGEGIDSTGDVLATVSNRMGYFVYGYKTFSSRIKGGHTNYKVRISSDPVMAPTKRTDILVALNQETIDRNAHELDEHGLLLADQAFDPHVPEGLASFHLLTLPLTEIAKSLGSVVMRNMVAVGASAALLQLPLEPFLAYVEEKFSRKGEAIVTANKNAVTEGYQRLTSEYASLLTYHLPEPHPGNRIVITGNEATALGAIAGGCRIMCGYPITPATDIMEALVKWFPLVGGAVVQMEDELGSITAAIGAGFTGARSMTATSGPGISLMQEAIGLAATAEVPVVVVDTQRSGPSTGMPTKEEQSDLMALIHGGHGEAPRIVLSPGSPEESFEDAHQAFDLAERFQCPVIIATDLSLALWKQTIERSVLDFRAAAVERHGIIAQERLLELGQDVFQRYQLTDSGVSERSLPGQKFGQYLATGSEHGVYGKVSEDPGNRVKMMQKRLGKLQQVEEFRSGVKSQGDLRAPVALVGIGATVGVMKEAQQLLAQKGRTVSVVWLRTLAPFPTNKLKEALQNARHIVVAEQNATAQLRTLIREAGIEDDRYQSLLKFNGVPFEAEEVADFVEQLLSPAEVLR